jgi:hypothetical protein
MIGKNATILRPKIWLRRIDKHMSNLSQNFKDIAEISPAPTLEKAILSKIELLEGQKVKRARIWSYAGFAVSVSTFLGALLLFGETFLQSEFWSILSLVFSDAQVVAGNWQDFGFSALETFPVIGTIAMLVPTVILLWSMSQYLEWHAKFKLVNKFN